MGVPEEAEREQDIENLFEKVITVLFPNLVREIDIKVQEAQRVSNKPKEAHTKTHHNENIKG